jgi:hypothetical protein
MIQRIQSVYLLMASVAIYLLFVFPVANIYLPNGAKKIAVTGVYENINEQVVQTIPFTFLTIATVIIGLIPIVLIFLFKDRKRQLTLIYLSIVLFIAFSFWLSKSVKAAAEISMQLSDYGIGAGLSSVAILFLVLAAKAIQRDDKLVKSADRLR